MQRETKRRIAYYQEALPDMKKRVVAAALMLLIAVVVSVTVSYAWITLSIAPVVSSVNTTMSANGTLEIALSPDDGSQPEEFDIDESVTASTDVTVSNLRWGNLINLSDSSYGIDSLVLRPAQLNTASLKHSPLWGAVYGADGRISTLDSNYTYTKWDGTDFMASRDYGVRAIASYKAGASAGTTAEYNRMAEAVNVANRNVNNAYQQVPAKMTSMSNMLSSFAQSKLDDAEKAFTSAELKSAYELYKALYDTMLLECDAMVALANFQSYVAAQNDPNLTYVPLTWEELVAGKASYNANSTTGKSSNGIVSITGLSQFITDLNTAKTDVESLEKYYKGVGDGTMTVYWSSGGDEGHNIVNIVTDLLEYGTMTMVFNGQEQTLVSLNAGMALDMLGLNNRHTNVYIYNGIVKRFEELAIDESARMQGQTNGAVATVKVKYIITVTVHGDCYTKASGASYFSTNYAAALGNKLVGTDVMAEDTYGMAVDFWLRTNAEETYLTLEGAMAVDENNVIQSYDGVNRVWGSTGNTALTTNSTTQGGGSCYIYYADTPEDMMRSLELLRSMKVAFVDKNGAMLALASMDTDNYYAVNGRITVPLAIEETSGVGYTYTDVTGTEQRGRAVALMTHDESFWVTAIVYLDGAYLSNDHVLAAADIDGQLNIQFGSSVDLETLGDNDLLTAERSVAADAYPKSLDWATAQQASDLTTNVTVTVDGTSPANVTAFFVRAINSTQGERQGTMTFTKASEDSNRWTAAYQFTAPGVYYLRHIRLDGVDYALENPVMVEVEGFSISEVKWGEAEKQAVIYSPESFYEATVSAKISSDDAGKMPKTVQARFLRDDGIMVNVDMRYDPSGKWTGEGTFYRSGTYALEYMLLDGEYYDISAQGYELTLYLGLNVEVHNAGSTTQDEYKAELAPYTKNVGVVISDNDGKILPVYEYDEEGNIKNDSNGDPKLLPWVSTARLRYSPGSSAANAVDSNLVWDEAAGWFAAQLAITSPGRYAFYDVTIDGDSLTRATDAPVFTVMPPDPPRYQTSQSTALQFAPLTNDGTIGPIKITDSQTAALVVEVHNSVTGQTYLIPNQAALDTNIEEDGGLTLSTANGLMTYDSGRESWFVKPVYTSGDTETQEGTWTVKNLYVWNYMDENGRLVEYDSHAVWSGDSHNYSGLTTEISCTLKVTMEPGNTTLGDSSTDFMTSHCVKDIGMKVLMKDSKDRLITGSVMDKMSVSLAVAYNSNTGDNYNAAYGYEVVGWNPTYTINFVYDSNSSSWVVNETNSNHDWQYVGEYTVNGLTVKVGSNTLSADKISGVPTMYTVISRAPDAENLSIKTISQQSAVFGKSGDTVTGTFLQSYDPGISATLKLTYDNGTKEATYARVEGTKVNLNLTYLDGNEAPNGGYTWTDSSPYSAMSLEMKNTNTGTSQYDSVATPLLAGTYDVSITLQIGDDEGDPITSVTDVNGVTKTLQDIEVYSKLPSLTVDSYSYDDGTPFTCIDNISESDWTMSDHENDPSIGNKLKNCTNELNDEASDETILTLHFPAVMIAEEYTRESGCDNITSTYYGLFYNNSTLEDDYTDSSRSNEVMPSISFRMNNIGNVTEDPEVTFTGNQTVEWTFDSSGQSGPKNIGSLNNSDNYHEEECGENSVFWTKRTTFGKASVTQVSFVNNGVTYTVDLEKKFTINNPN